MSTFPKMTRKALEIVENAGNSRKTLRFQVTSRVFDSRWCSLRIWGLYLFLGVDSVSFCIHSHSGHGGCGE